MQSLSYPFTTPSSTCLSEDLLFFDTFSHSGSERDNFDLVQFPSPVVIDLIKIVPLGQPIEAKIPGNVRLGATNPSNCELEFFINDLSKQDAHTMTDLGKFYCNEKDTDFNPPLQIQTDGLLLRGSYRTLTLAIFGQIASYDEKAEDDMAILSATSPPAQTPASPVASERDIPYIVRSVDQEILRRTGEESESFDESTLKSGEIIKDGILIDNVEMIDDPVIDFVDPTDLRARAGLEELSNSEGGPSTDFTPQDKKIDDNELTDVPNLDNFTKRPTKEESTKRSNENLDNIDNEEQSNDDEDDYNDRDFREWSFNADTYPLKPLMYFADPAMTIQERSISLQESEPSFEYKELVGKEIEKVKELFEALNCNDDLKSEDWVTLVEDLTNDIANMSLSRTVENKEMLNFLVQQICYGLDFSLALKQKQTGFKVRHLRAGVKLANILFHCGDEAVLALTEAGVPQKLLHLYDRDQMSLPFRLLIFKCLSAACDSVAGVIHMTSHKYSWVDASISIEAMRRQISEREKPKKSMTQEGEESDSKFDSTSTDGINEHEPENNNTISDQLPTSHCQVSPDRSESRETNDNEDSLTCYQYMVLILLSQPTTRVTISIGNLIKKIRLFQNLSSLVSLNSEESEQSEDSVFDSHKPDNLRSDNLEQSLLLVQDIVNLTKDGCTNIAQPIRYLPAKVQFQIKPNPLDNHLAIYKWLKHFNILECLNSIININQIDSMSAIDIDRTIRLQSLCVSFVQQILDSPRGAQFFLSRDNCEITANILRSLAEKQPLKRSSHWEMSDGMDHHLSETLSREQYLLAESCHDISLRLAYSFKIFACIDKLFHFHREIMSNRKESSLYDPEKVLHQLYIMSEHPYGLSAIVKHFSCIGNLDCLLRFLDMPEYHKQLEFVKETSIDYVIELIGTFFRLNNNVLEIADEYLDTLIDLCKTKDKNLSVRLKSLLPWLSPFDSDQPFPLITYSEDTFNQLTRVIRKSIPNYSIPFAKGLDFELPPQLITAVRILRQLCIPPQVEQFIEASFDVFSSQRLATPIAKSSTSADSIPLQKNLSNPNMQLDRSNGGINPSDNYVSDQLGQIGSMSKLYQPYDESICGELKYHYGIMQVFEKEGLKRLLNTLRELVGNYPKPIHQAAALSGFRGRIVISYIHSVIILLHSITCHLIDARGSEFKDTSIIPVVLETYSLLSFVPAPQSKKTKETDGQELMDLATLQKSVSLRSDNYQLAQQTKKLILSILMSYTQMCLSVSESEEKVISKSMWTKMLKEVIDFTLSTPVFFCHGLDVLTKILPSPSPSSSTMDPVDLDQSTKNINHRKLWSAHLHPLHHRIEQLISPLSICYQSNIRTLLYYLCNQLCDLSSNAACMVAKIITDTLVGSAAKLFLDANGNTSPDHGQTSSHQQQQLQIGVVLNGAKESGYAVKMILNLLSNLINNQAFETAITNHLQVIGKKDEKLLANLQNSLRLHEGCRPNELTEESSNSSNLANVTNLIETIKSIHDSSSRDGHSNVFSDITTPPEELTKINLLEVAHKSTDRFSLSSSLKKTYRLKVLLDLNSRAHRSTETSSSSKRFDQAPYNYQEISVPSSNKAYVAPLRGRGRPIVKPDSFRTRPQNTSRPPSIHVDDFIDLYGDNSAQSSSARYSAQSGKSSDYRGSSRGYPPEMIVQQQNEAHRHPSSAFFSPQPPPPMSSGSPYSNSGSRSQQHLKPKYMKMK